MSNDTTCKECGQELPDVKTFEVCLSLRIFKYVKVRARTEKQASSIALDNESEPELPDHWGRYSHMIQVVDTEEK